MKTVTINSFNHGMTANARDNNSSFCRLCKHFDVTTDRNVITPRRRTTDADSSSTTQKIKNFAYSGTTLYGLGVKSGTSDAKVFYKTDFTSAGWSALGNGEDTVGGVTVLPDLFIAYNGYVYIGNSSGISKAKLDASAFTQLDYGIGHSTITQGLVHSKDNVLYVGRDYFIATNNAGSWTGTALTLPSSKIITSLAEYGNYLAIGCQSSTSGGRSVVYLWDRDSSVSTISESIDWGTGDLLVLEYIDGALIGISMEYSSVALEPKIVFRKWTGGASATVFRTIRATQQFTTVSLKKNKQKVNNTLYFFMTIVINGSTHEGVWSVSRTSPNDEFAVSFSHLVNNDNALTSGVLNGFYLLGDYMFISYQDNSAYAMSKTDYLANYTATSIYETLINPGMPENDRFAPKKLYGIRVSFVPLPSGGTVTIKYRTDGQLNASWTSCITASTTGQASVETSVDASGYAFTDGTDFEIRVESTGGAQITGIQYRYDTLNSLV